MDLQIRITATDGSSCVVEVIDNPWYRIDLPNDHWELTSGGLTGVSSRQGTFGRFASLLNLHGLARLNFPSPVSVASGIRERMPAMRASRSRVCRADSASRRSAARRNAAPSPTTPATFSVPVRRPIPS